MRGLDREALEEFSSSSFLPCIPPEAANLWCRNINTASHFQGPSTHRLQILDYHSDKLQVLTSSETESLGLGSILGVTHRRQGGRALWVWLLSSTWTRVPGLLVLFSQVHCAYWLPIVTADCCLSSTQMQRLQQWEAQMLLEIEEAVHHELTIQEGILCTEFPDQTQGPLSFGTVRVEAQDPATLE